ncbi:MAG: VWA domain-containing protein [Sandaracinaceae bacterium]|nr:VWA domain-containing protein [Sandaracinaceae bacterium]
MRLVPTLTLAALMASGCSCTGALHASAGPCADPATAPAECNQTCSPASPCPAGFYCHGSGVCTADCEPASPEAGCPAPGRCTSEGRCLRPDMDSGTGRRDGDLPDGDPNICADINVGARRVTPNVILVIDQSGSMTADFGGTNRWDGLRDSLLGQPDGFVFALQSSVRFGIALFSARADPDDGPVMGMCPLITWVDPAIDNFSAISAVYGPADPIDETPTGDSIDAVLQRMMSIPDPTDDPTIFVLATDGEPDTCEDPNPQNGQAESIAAVERAYAAGIRTFVISVGNDVGMTHLQDVANAGVGMPSSGSAPFWVAGDDQGLRTALNTIIGGALSCDLELRGRIQDLSMVCSGTINLIVGGMTMSLPCNDPNGWRAIDETHIQLQGDACDLLLSSPGASVQGVFPCEIILI